MLKLYKMLLANLYNCRCLSSGYSRCAIVDISSCIIVYIQIVQSMFEELQKYESCTNVDVEFVEMLKLCNCWYTNCTIDVLRIANIKVA